MGGRRQQASGKALAVSVAWIIGLLACYWLIADWNTLPSAIASAIARMG
jgi:hypothetical protein